MRVAPKVGVGARSVVRAAVGQGEWVPMHGGRDIGLWSPVGKVAVPFLVAGTEMLHLEEKSSSDSPVCVYEPLDAAVSTFFNMSMSLMSH